VLHVILKEAKGAIAKAKQHTYMAALLVAACLIAACLAVAVQRTGFHSL
jgi:hypothetical protein